MAKKGKRDELLFLEDILDSAIYVQGYMRGVSESSFRKNVEKQDSVIRRIEIIGEAVKNLSDQIRSGYDQVPWKKIAGMRDVVTHHYFGVNYDLIWKVVKKDLNIRFLS